MMIGTLVAVPLRPCCTELPVWSFGIQSAARGQQGSHPAKVGPPGLSSGVRVRLEVAAALGRVKNAGRWARVYNAALPRPQGRAGKKGWDFPPGLLLAEARRVVRSEQLERRLGL